jgi:hypothetical protein
MPSPGTHGPTGEGTNGPSAPGLHDPQISVLKQKVMTAVRTAITESLIDSPKGRPHPVPDLDLDFSMSPEPAGTTLTVPPAGVTAVSVVAAAPTVVAISKPPLSDFSRGSQRDQYPRRKPVAPAAEVRARRGRAGLWMGLLAIGVLACVGAVAVTQPAIVESLVGSFLSAPRNAAEVKQVKVPTPPAKSLPAAASPKITSTASVTTTPPPPKPVTKTASPTAAVIAPAPPAPAVKPTPLVAFREAQSSVGKGAVLAARASLLAMAESQEPGVDRAEVAFALARSYDPNHLRTVAKADATADRGEAERWYRRWYALSVEAGTVSDGARLERLLRSLK